MQIEREDKGSAQSQPGSDAQERSPDQQHSDGWWLLNRLFVLGQAAQAYFDGYCQDEAADDGPDFTGCSVEQHLAAKALGDALKDYSGEETLRAVQAAVAAPDGWQDLATAPTNGTIIDVWRPEGGRSTVYWGYPPHECGEMGQYCDSDWHSIRAPGWVCDTFGELLGRKHAPFTHWMPLPPPPAKHNLTGAQRSELTRSAQDEPFNPPPSDHVGGEG